MLELGQNWLIAQGLDSPLADMLVRSAIGVVILLMAWISGVVARRIVLRLIAKLVATSKTHWDDIFLEHGVLDHLVRLVPALVLQVLTNIPLAGYETALRIVHTAIDIYMLAITILVLDATLNAVLHIFRQSPASKKFSLKSFIQIAKIIIYFLIGILMVSKIMNTSPIAFLSGLGAMTAIILLIFRDSILGFVAGIQLTVNNMVSRGDWIEMPKYGADGDVIEITLSTVKVQNWDKTITTIPTYALISDAFKNWRGMAESGGRRIKRSIAIDMTMVRICDDAMIEHFKKFAYIKDYIEGKQTELAEWNAKNGLVDEELINGRRMTNLGTFRIYMSAYLKQHPMVHDKMTFLIRQLQPTEKGLPIEIYIFLKEQRWAEFEAIQSDIFDHIVAVIPEFGLKIFQQPTGQDVAALARSG